jgi:hypothetical protein
LGSPRCWVAFGDFPVALFTFGPQANNDDGSWLNVLVRHERISPDTNIVDIAKASWAEQQESAPDLVCSGEWFLHLTQNHYMRQIEIPKTSTSAALMRYDTFVQSPENHATNDLFHFTWLMPTEFLVQFRDEIFKILESFRFD